ncbi:MAG TPA: hypothetical protein VKR30_01025 [Candidatus Limnocylindrales bacterium]|nr:hypothetical protein [Candidatus Limnocylindrales bacterium]
MVAGLVFGVLLLAGFAYTGLTAPQLGDRLAAATGAATTVLALVAGATAAQNFLLIAAARQQASESRDLVAAALEQAAASDAQAKGTMALVEEARLDREYEFRPLLTLDITERGTVGARPFRRLIASNIGRGPALNVAVATHDFVGGTHVFGSSGLFDLGPGARRELEIYDEAGAAGQTFRRLVDGLPEPSVAVGFVDLTGNKYRVALVDGFRRPLETRRRDDPQVLDWAAWT